jgi:dTDP-4-dehydrorhamnose reductase
MTLDESSILITGGGGMLAGAFRRRMPGAHFVARTELDITSERAIEQLFQQHRPAIVINCAAYTKVDQAEQEEDLASAINGHAVGALARACRAHDAMLVHFSTDYVFDGTIRRPLRPDDPVGPQSAYGRSKLLGEQLLQKHAPQRWLIIRTAWLYGPGGPSFPRAILNAAGAGKPLTVVDDQLGSPTYTRDLADATLRLMDLQAPSGIWHLANSGETTWFGFAREILDEFQLRVPVEPIGSEEWKARRPASATRPAYSVLDTSACQQLTGQPMRHWREALTDFRNAMQEP